MGSPIGATVNDTEGWVQNLNAGKLQTALTDYQTKIKTYIDTTKKDATVGDVLGSKTIIPEKLPYLAGSLQYKTVALAGKYSAWPSTLRHQFQYKIYLNAYERALDNPLLSYQSSLPNLAGKRVTLTYTPASPADLALINSYLPKPHADGSPIDPSELPKALPGYLIHVKPELRVEGTVVATGPSLTMGTALLGEGSFTQPDLSDWDRSTDGTLIVGQSSAIGLSIQGISSTQLTALKTRLANTKAKLEAKDLTGLTGEQIVGDLLTANVWGYFAGLQTYGNIAQGQANMIDLPALSYGLFHATVLPNMAFGIPTSVKFPGVMMDIGHLRHNRIAKDGDPDTWVSYNRMRGQHASAMEHAIPEQFFTDPSTCNAPGTPTPDPKKPDCAQGVSAVKAIAVAASQGQKIFTITSANAAVALPKLSHSASVMDEIRNALATGKEVTISEKRVTVGSWTGSGYIVVDPNTGGGAYLIEGANGGSLFLGALNGFGLAALLGGLAFGAAPALMMVLGVILVASVIASLIALAVTEASVGCYYQGIGSGFGLYGIAGSMLAHYGVLGGIEEAASAGKLLVNLLVPFVMDRVLPSDPAWQCVA